MYRPSSPELTLKPLEPYRPRRPVLSMQSMSAPVVPQTLNKLHSARSCEQLKAKKRQSDRQDRSKLLIDVSPPSTPRSLPAKRRSLQSAIPYRSPPPSPTVEAVPPVPEIPPILLAPTDKKPVIHPTLVSPCLPDIDTISPISPSIFSPFGSPRKQRQSNQKGREMPMTCSSFFSLHNSPQTASRTCAV